MLRKSNQGWSLVELTIILVVLSILSAILAPVIGRFVRNARLVRAREDTKAIGTAVWMFISDTALNQFLVDGNTPGQAGATGPSQAAANGVSMLVTNGDVPQLRPGVGGAAERWQRHVGVADRVDFLENHLAANQPFGNPGWRYRGAEDLDNSNNIFAQSSQGGFNAEFAWRGPYVTAPLLPDPWGNRYAVNADAVGDVFILSAGPDGEIDTPYDVYGPVPGDDDIMYVIGGNSRP